MEVPDRTKAILALDGAEVALVRARLEDPRVLDAEGEAVLRTAIALSRLYRIAGPRGEVDVEPFVLPLRQETLKLLDAVKVRRPHDKPDPKKLPTILRIIRDPVLKTRALLEEHFAGALGPELLDREVRQKRLVLALGGGGGVGYSYLAVFKLLEEHGITPALLVGTSIGAVMGLLRARTLRYSFTDALAGLRELSIGRLFRVLSTESRYGLPALMRLYLRSAVGPLFEQAPGDFAKLDRLPIPLVTCVAGIKAGVLPRPLSFYEGLLGDPRLWSNPVFFARRMPVVIAAVSELILLSDRLERLALGLERGTESLDALDAVGFSCALPGVLHYDVTRDDPIERGKLDAFFERRKIFRMADGGLVENVPVRTAWEAVQQGHIGTRNALILALDGFAPKLLAPQWLPIQALIVTQVQRSRSFAHVYHAFRATLPPLDISPELATLLPIVDAARQEFEEKMVLVRRLMEPLPRLDETPTSRG